MSKPYISPLVVALAIAGIVACSAFIYFQVVRGMSPTEPPAPPVPAPVESPPPPAPSEPEIEVPPLDASDELIRSLAGQLSEHPRLAAVLAPDSLVRRFVAAVVNVANDESPRPHLQHLAPGGAFRVSEREGALFVAPESYARYDRITSVVDSLDDDESLRLYRSLKPLFDEAYSDLGYPGGDFDVALARAIDRLLLTPIPEGGVALKRRVKNYRFTDPRLEELSPVEKHLVRMGPANAARIKAKLRLLRAELS